MKIELEKGMRVHLVGIKGVGMTALALVLSDMGVVVSGSDTDEKFFTDEVLRNHKIKFVQKFSEKNITPDIDLVVSSTAYFFKNKSLGNVETAKAKKSKLPVLTYPQAIGTLSKNFKVIAVAGTHGKSTTTAMLGLAMEADGKDPNVIVGTRVNKWSSNARTGKSKYLVVEADEYRGAFLNYKPYGVILTSIDYDHPDYYKTQASYLNAFKKLIKNINPSGWLVAYGDDENVKKIIKLAQSRKIKTLTYGLGLNNDLVLRDMSVKRMQLFHAAFTNKQLELSVPFPGLPYILNSGAVVATARILRLSDKNLKKALTNFPGTARRFDVLKANKNYTIIDDYAHHPTAIRLTLAGVKQMFPKNKIIAVFQPHMFSRTRVLLNDFAESFEAADEVGIMEVYSSARETSGAVGGKQLAEKIKVRHKKVKYLVNFSSAKKFVSKHSKDNNVIVLMGAGNIADIV